MLKSTEDPQDTLEKQPSWYRTRELCSQTLFIGVFFPQVTETP